ncbi:MAG TPA: FAD-binding oxidoreductase [Candidatus Norongarragalinales archaeon]|nr:FAD-binding oxidoreductase [Candidatus Norongarragalinales archaeon]
MEFDAEAIEIRDYRDEDKVQMLTVKLRVPLDQKFEYKAGQYMMLAMDGFTLRSNSNALKWTSYSIASSPHQTGMVEFCLKIKETGGFTQFARDNLKLGTKLHLKGPFGNFVNENPMPGIILVAAGSGIAPIIGMLRWLLNSGCKSEIQLVYGFRNMNYFVYKEELEQYSKSQHNFTLIPTLSRPDAKWQGRKGYVQDALKDLRIDDPHDAQAFICGLPIMVEEVRKVLHEKGLTAHNVHSEQWAGA